MRINTKDFAGVCKTISAAVDKDAANLELKTRNGKLYLAVTNGEYYVCVNFDTKDDEDFRATVDANLFLNLIAGITAEEFDLKIDGNAVKVKAGKSNYKLPIIYVNDQEVMSLTPITIANKTVEMPISNDILQSILNVNSKEVAKVKNGTVVNELQKLYYLTDEGCFTFTTGACLNTFKLAQPIKVLLDDRLVKLFKLFKDDVQFSFGYDSAETNIQSKVIFETPNTYLSAKIINDDVLLSRIQGPCTATKNYIKENYANKVVLSVNELTAAINRLMLFTKNSITGTDLHNVNMSINISPDGFALTDKLGNTEVVTVENGSYIDSTYDLFVNVADIKLVLDTCKDEHITFNCGNHKSIVINRGTISHLIPESVSLK